MTSTPVYTSTAEGFRDAKEIAGLRPIAAPKPRAPRKATEKRVVSSGIVCFCGERFGESQSLEFMLHLRAEVGEVLDWKENFTRVQRAAHKRHREKPEVREHNRQRKQNRRADPAYRAMENEKSRVRMRGIRADLEAREQHNAQQREYTALARALHAAGDHSRCPPSRCAGRRELDASAPS